jgi:tetratricopeptide (TPR) repeat protein
VTGSVTRACDVFSEAATRREEGSDGERSDGERSDAGGEESFRGKARSYLEASLSIDPSYSAHLELARLLEKTGDPEKAAAHYREALSQTLAQLEQVTGGRRRAGL